MTKGDAVRWHAALAAAAGMLSGAIARDALSARLVNSIASVVKPVLREIEIEEITFLAREKVEAERIAKPQRQPRIRR